MAPTVEPRTMELVVGEGVRLHVEVAGAGPRLLVIGGTGGDLRTRPNVLHGPLPGHFTVAAYDQRGLGRSDVPPGPYTMAGYADDAAAVLAGLGWDDARVLGVSFGGMVAQELAIRHPHRVTALVLACTSSGGAGGSSYPLERLARLDDDQRVVRTLELMDTSYDEAWREAHRDQWQALVELAAANLRPGTVGRPPGAGADARDGAALQLEARSHHDTWDRLASIRCPTLVCGGRTDGVAPPENLRRLASAIPGCRLAFFDGGHLFMLQDPAAVPAMIRFLQAPEHEDP